MGTSRYDICHDIRLSISRYLIHCDITIYHDNSSENEKNDDKRQKSGMIPLSYKIIK